jgi:XTP/dITP diphosphohydrolase
MPRSHKQARQKLVVASANRGKLGEVGGILADLDWQLIPQGELGIAPAAENGETFAENALIKARHAAEKSGLPAIADDSGLLVDALDGRPGVHSARYAGPDAHDDDNVEKLLAELQELPVSERGAHYMCAAVWVSPDDSILPIVAEGRWHGRIISERRGDGGFGYDPVFLDEDLMKTGAEMSMEEKNRRSHRGKAFVALRDLLSQ